MTKKAIFSVEHTVEKKNLELSVWEKFAQAPAQKPIIVLAHGSATAGRESFDLQVPGKPSYSLMDFLANEGFDVFAPDIRGFGRSTHPETHVSTADALEDLNTVVEYILQLRAMKTVSLVCWSWGTQYGGMLAMSFPEKIEKYVSYAQMHIDSPDLARRRHKLEFFQQTPYVSIPEDQWKPRFSSMTPEDANDPAVIECFARTAATVEKKTPTGPQIDMINKMPMLNPRLIQVPTMIIHGVHDDVADIEGLAPFFRLLPNAYKRYVVVPAGGHMLHLQKGHLLFQREVATFLKTPVI